ncbi:MAG: hypothetical protein HYR84_12175 [Planctomycetes bacterium]|nr:hypothetical protein [Planctomycetota bacterium]
MIAVLRAGASWSVVLGMLVLLCTSCHKESRKPVFPARGKVVLKSGAAAEGVLVIFTPTADVDPAKDWPDGFPRATTEKDGTFVLTTYEPGDGIPVGQYAVTMLWTLRDATNKERSGPDKFGGRFANPQKPAWTVTIREGENDLPTFTVP